VTKTSFASAFQDALDVACGIAEKKLNTTLSRDAIIKMYGAGQSGLILSPAEFVCRAYISDTEFYRLIDLMVVETIGTKPVVFARISGHPPGSLSSCWNGDKGPFKQLYAAIIAQK